MDRMMEFMMGRMSQEDKDNMMDKMMGKFFVDMTAEDKQKMMGMMSKMMEGGQGTEMTMMPQMMMGMMPQCVKMMFPNMPKEERIDFVLEMVTTLKEQASVDMSETEKKDFVVKIIKKVNA